MSDHPNKDELKGELSLLDAELINRRDVVGYDFIRQADSTSVNVLPLTKTGFVAKSLNDTLERLYLETIKINDQIAGSE